MPKKSKWDWLYDEMGAMLPRDMLTITREELDKTGLEHKEIAARFKRRTGISMGYVTADNGDKIFIRLDK